ncbi:hypothetical protein [Microtetraspora glauca]|uniref:GNAT family N-acetyltransferase n=1 Tax=Microtetraspora glauca TaxID=1996 RepID=A0ABV3GTN0_MICGL
MEAELMDLRACASNERGDVVECPTSKDVRVLLDGLTSANRFVIVERLDAEPKEPFWGGVLDSG